MLTGYKISVWEEKNGPEIYGGDKYPTMWTQRHENVHVKVVFFACLCKYAYLSTIKILVQYICTGVFVYMDVLYV